MQRAQDDVSRATMQRALRSARLRTQRAFCDMRRALATVDCNIQRRTWSMQYSSHRMVACNAATRCRGNAAPRQRCAAATLQRGNAATLHAGGSIPRTRRTRASLTRPRANTRTRTRASCKARTHTRTRAHTRTHARAHERRYIKDSLSSLWPDDPYAKKASRVQPLALRVSTGTHRVLTGYSQPLSLRVFKGCSHGSDKT